MGSLDPQAGMQLASPSKAHPLLDEVGGVWFIEDEYLNQSYPVNYHVSGWWAGRSGGMQWQRQRGSEKEQGNEHDDMKNWKQIIDLIGNKLQTGPYHSALFYILPT